VILKRPVHPPALSVLIIKLAASDDGASALARVMREIFWLEFAWEEKVEEDRRKKGMCDCDSLWLFCHGDNGWGRCRTAMLASGRKLAIDRQETDLVVDLARREPLLERCERIKSVTRREIDVASCEISMGLTIRIAMTRRRALEMKMF